MTIERSRYSLLALAIAAPAAAFGATSASAATYEIEPGADSNKVTFESKAPLESFEGSTRNIEGRIELDPASLGDSITVEISVDLASLDTGIDLRNRHMRENHLHTDQHPKAVFRGVRLNGQHPTSLEPGKPANFTVTGSFSLHGVMRRVDLPVELTLSGTSDALEVRSQFVVFLADYEIPRPKMLFVKLDEKQTVKFRAVAKVKR
jgi:polyisoprenoid-binding protein YceI